MRSRATALIRGVPGWSSLTQTLPTIPIIWSHAQMGAGGCCCDGAGGGGGVQGPTAGKLWTHFSQMCSMPSCVSATLLKDVIYTASTDPTVKNIVGSGCQRNVFRKHPLSIRKHRTIQALQSGHELCALRLWTTHQAHTNARNALRAR